MSEINETVATPEQLQAVREKYAAPPTKQNGSLTALVWVAILGFAIAIIGMIVLTSAESMLTATIWGALIGPGVTAGFIAVIAYLATKAIITTRK